MQNNKRKTISILGCGWMGLPLAEKMISKGYSVKGSTTSKEKVMMLKEKGIEPYLINLNFPIEEDNEGFFKCDILILNFPPGRVENIQEIYPKQVKACCKMILKKAIRRVIFTSSTSVYPNNMETVFENSRLIPQKASGQALLEAENILQQSDAYKCSVLRMAGLISEDRIPGKRFSKSNLKIHPQERVNLVHRDDCVSIIQKVIEKDAFGKIYNVCSDAHPTKMELYTQTSQIFQFDLPQFNSDKKPSYKIVDNTLLKKELNYLYLYPDPLRIYS